MHFVLELTQLDDPYVGKDEIKSLKRLLCQAYNLVSTEGIQLLQHPEGPEFLIQNPDYFLLLNNAFIYRSGNFQVCASAPWIFRNSLTLDSGMLMNIVDDESEAYIQMSFFGPALGFEIAACFGDGINYRSEVKKFNDMTETEWAIISSYCHKFLSHSRSCENHWGEFIPYQLGPQTPFCYN